MSFPDFFWGNLNNTKTVKQTSQKKVKKQNKPAA